jgi:diguanylate cyclase (GGDEF)-like protein
MRVISCLFVEHNLWLVALAAIVCVSGSGITFGLYSRARERTGLQKHGWTFLTAVAAGSSIWCTHFIAMLAYEVTAPVTFDPVLTMASLIVAIAGCGVGFGLSSIDEKRFSPEVCGSIVGMGVGLMHYTGMAAYHVTGFVEWNLAYVAASLAIAAVVAALALREAVRRPRKHSHYIAIGLFVVAIVGLHFTGMAAVSVSPIAGLEPTSNQQAFITIAVAVAGVGLMVIGTGVAAYLIDERTSADTVERLQRMALNDALTGLPNRVHFSDYLDREIERAQANGWTIAVLGIDLDRFKEINDVRGHDAGDKALKIIAGRLAALLQPGEFAARVGGDEFAAAKRYVTMDDMHDFAARIEKALFEPVLLDGFEVVTGGSIGIALFPQDGAQASALVSNADLAMYRAKGDVGRTICFYEKQMDDAARARRQLAADLRRAIELGEFALNYQVQSFVQTGDISGYEVLLRWHHRERGMIAPAQFIPIAEECGAIIEIGEWVLRTACREALNWSRPHKIAVNVSAVQLAHGDFAETVKAVLIETGFPPGRLEIEITESAIISDKVRALHVLRRIRSFGVSIAIDDFGVGYSSLETLRTFPFDKIKLDRSFTHGLENDAQSRAIVRAVLALGKCLEIPVLAEGVETKAQLSTLRVEGCDEAQGYYLGRPGPLSALPDYAVSQDESAAALALALAKAS